MNPEPGVVAKTATGGIGVRKFWILDFGLLRSRCGGLLVASGGSGDVGWWILGEF
jgi:hypothetical protein